MIPNCICIRVKNAKTGDISEVEILTKQETFGQFKTKIEASIQGQISQMTWMEHPLDLKDGDISVQNYLQRYLNGHPNGMEVEHLQNTQLVITVQAVGGQINPINK